MESSPSLSDCNAVLDGSRNSVHEFEELALVQLSYCANAGAKIDSERANRTNSFFNVCGVQSTGEEDWDAGLLNDPGAHVPVVCAAGAAQLLGPKRLIAGIEEKGVD